MIVVLVVASGATWESPALTLLTNHRDIVVLKRCVDLTDLLASAASGTVGVVVVSGELPGLDALIGSGAPDELAAMIGQSLGSIDSGRPAARLFGCECVDVNVRRYLTD